MNRKQLIKLKDCFILSDLELVYIKRVHSISPTLLYTSHTSQYQEIQILAEATSYYLNHDSIQKQDINNLFLTIDELEIIPVSEANIALLMIDDQELVRAAAIDFYRKVS